MERCCPSRSALRENDLSAALGSPHALPRKSGDGPHAPSTFISMSFADACRREISGWYSGDVYQAFSAAMSGNSMITTRSGCHTAFSFSRITWAAALGQIAPAVLRNQGADLGPVLLELCWISNCMLSDDIGWHSSTPRCRPLSRISARPASGKMRPLRVSQLRTSHERVGPTESA
jgi:hypothetical protein